MARKVKTSGLPRKKIKKWWARVVCQVDSMKMVEIMSWRQDLFFKEHWKGHPEAPEALPFVWFGKWFIFLDWLLVAPCTNDWSPCRCCYRCCCFHECSFGVAVIVFKRSGSYFCRSFDILLRFVACIFETCIHSQVWFTLLGLFDLCVLCCGNE